jgi:hypothetical protein
VATQFRAASIQEAVESILRCILKQSRKQQLDWFRKEYGNEFADEVKILVEAQFKKKRK